MPFKLLESFGKALVKNLEAGYAAPALKTRDPREMTEKPRVCA